WIFDSGASGHVTPNADHLANFRQCQCCLRVASGSLLPIEGHGDIIVDFQSVEGVVRVVLSNVAFVPRLNYNLLSLPTITADRPNSFFVDGSVEEVACATIAPGLLLTTNVDINVYHRSTSHTHHRLLAHSAKQRGVTLKKGGQLQPCVGCSAAKGYNSPVKMSIECRSDEKLDRVFVDLSGIKPVKSHGGNQYSMGFRDDNSRITWEYYLRSKDEAPIALEEWLTDVRSVGVPKIIRSDDANELRGGRFGEIWRTHRIKREFTAADRPQLNGVAERGLTLIAKLAKASAIQAKV
ncbi:unnamed protein product, partial [Scytosiphon promiscuus]